MSKTRAVVCISLSALLGCGGQDKGLSDDDQQQVRADILARAGETSELQQEILADGVITETEVDRAVSALVDCASAQGIEVETIPGETGPGFTFDASGSEDPNDALEIFTACEDREYVLVGQLLSIQDARPQEEVDEMNRLVAECLIEAGFAVGQWPDVEVEPDPEVEAVCVDEAERSIEGS